MSKWSEAFEKHDQRGIWDALVRLIEDKKLNEFSSEAGQPNILRLKKCLTYLKGIIESIDHDLVPLVIWDTFFKNCNEVLQLLRGFHNQFSRSNIDLANGKVDALLSLLRPYEGLNSESIKQVSSSLKRATENIEDLYEGIKGSAKEKIAEIGDLLEAAQDKKEQIDQVNQDLHDLRVKLSGGEQQTGLKHDLEKLRDESLDMFKQIKDFQAEIFFSGGLQPPIKQQIAQARDESLKATQTISDRLAQMEEKLKKINIFHVKIYGIPAEPIDPNNPEAEVTKPQLGLKHEIDERMRELEDFKSKQHDRYQELNKQIESLMPGATSTGLATAYREMKESFDEKIKWSSRMFYCAIGLLVLLAIYLQFEISVDATAGTTFRAITIGSWSDVLSSMLAALPIYAPLIWFAVHASRRRSQQQRLQQEYAHKEALAKSYNSYKQQIEALSDGGDDQMMKFLMTSAIDAIAYNASATLDGQHGDKHPLLEAVGSLKPSKKSST